jgi:PAS domain S-box-containing protein
VVEDKEHSLKKEDITSDLLEKLAALRARAEDAEETLRAINRGEVDALVVSTSEGDQVFTLRGAESPYRTIVESMNEGAATLTDCGLVLYANTRLAEMLKNPLLQVIGSTLFDITPEQEHRRLAVLLKQGLRRQATGEISLITRENNSLPVQISLRRLAINGEFGLSAVFTDITEIKRTEALLEKRVQERTAELIAANDKLRQEIAERKRAEEALRRSEQHIRDVLDNLVALVGVTTPDGILIEANRTSLEMAGIRAVDVIGKPFEETYWWSWSSEVQKQLSEAIANAAAGQSSRYDVTVRMAKGRLITIDFMLVPLFDEHGEVKYLIPSAIDITDRKHAEMERERLISELEAANRELEGFTYSVSHDLRAPIRHISSFAQLLKKDAWPVLSKQSRSFLSTVLKSSGKMGILVDELLAFSRMGRTELIEGLVDLMRIVREAIQNLSSETEERDIRWIIAELPVVWGDPTMLQLVFLNLIGNALKFTYSRSDAFIEIGYIEKKTEHVLFVRDNGIGFDMQYYDKLFGVFQRLHTAEEIEGTGIGLANVARIVQRHGGRVWAEGKVNEGAVFYLSLPKEKGE